MSAKPIPACLSPRARAVLRNRELAERGLRWCSSCQAELPLTAFHRLRNGYQCRCRTCAIAYSSECQRRQREQDRMEREEREEREDPTIPVPSPLARLDLSRVGSDVAALDPGSWPKHLQRFAHLSPVAALTDADVATGYALADAAPPLGRGWTPAGWHVGGRT